MNKFTGAESARLLCVLTEAVEKLTLLSHLPYMRGGNDGEAAVAQSQSTLVDALPSRPRDGHYEQSQPPAADVLAQLFAQEEILLRATHGGKIDLMHDGGEGAMAFDEVVALTRSFCRIVRHDATAHAVLTTIDGHRESAGASRHNGSGGFASHSNQESSYPPWSHQLKHGTSGLVALSGYVTAVRDRVAGTLSTSVEQDEATRQMMGDMEIRIREAENDYKQTTIDVRNQRELRDIDVRRYALKIHGLTHELHDIEQGADQAATLIEQDAKHAEFSLLNTYEGQATQCRDEADSLNVRGTKSKEDHSVQEEGHRKRKLKAAVEVGNQIEQYDHDLTALQAQIDATRASMATEVTEVARLSAIFLRLDENYRFAAADHARWDAEDKARLAKEAAFLKLVARIQATYRGYITRKLLNARKERKKGKKKGKKGAKKSTKKRS
ncbi:hypothetical protein H310_07203 [Aphanomyces invadans]|uniref:Dynein regulatory complex protein 10 n=1 Tax=Aphanomyces invadans TaxID=157072 RepID=A0A024U303_9STRA|nr:hypothetical protein H310_07203 [Aphanomyces invadans]ETW00634.1 hypothetical protein H310_07203 [Aphanomyces invadans]|eukprot:XP_008870769.1 hypothetical protein H310_07203 [Aphanomyces invadans]